MSEPIYLDKKRFEAFIDAIFAIVITFLVLEFKVPHIENADRKDLVHYVLDLLPLFLCYTGSFFTIVSIWFDHHLLFKYIKFVDKRYALLNFIFMLTVSLLPFTTGFAGSYFEDSFAVALYCSSILVMNIFFSFLFYDPARNKALDETFYKVGNENSNALAMGGLVAEAAAIPLAYVNTLISITIIFIVLIVHYIKWK